VSVIAWVYIKLYVEIYFFTFPDIRANLVIKWQVIVIFNVHIR